MRKRPVWTFIVLLLTVLLLAACGTRQESPTISEQLSGQGVKAAPVQNTHEEDANSLEAEAGHQEGEAQGHDEEGEDHGAGAHGIPEEAANIPNPIAPSQASIAAGAEKFSTLCAVCHGEQGFGDGPGGAALDPPPANLHEDHVQVLSDGALFYVIQNGVEGTGMPAWGATLGEEDIWNVVNFIRTLKE